MSVAQEVKEIEPMAKSYTYHGVTVDRRLNADEQRSLAMTLRNLQIKRGFRISESVIPVEPTPISRARSARPASNEESVVNVSDAEFAEYLDSIVNEAPKSKVKAAPAAKAKKRKANDFYEKVIVGKRDARAKAKPYKCEAKGCYKYGRRFSRVGWFGTKDAKGHIALSPKH